MITYKEWLGSDPEWEKMKNEWKNKTNSGLVNKMKLRVESIKENYVRDLGDEKIKTFRDVPPSMRDDLAKAIVIATFKSFYDN